MARHRFSKYLKNTLRAEEIVLVLLRHGLGDWVARLRLGRFAGFFKRNKASAEFSNNTNKARAVRIRLALEELGPTFVKFGQILSNRADILNEELIDELCKLQDNVPPFPLSSVREIIESELSCPLDQIFFDFSPAPIASASIAQVHEAWLENGQRVAVKVQRPGIEELILQDCEVLMFLAGLAVRYIPEIRHFDPVGLIQEFKRQVLLEIDFEREANHVEHFAINQKHHNYIVIPKVFKKYSRQKILTLEYINGTRLRDHLGTPEQANVRLLAKRLANSMLEQIFIFGFFHADPHPGNIFILSDGRICFLDFGMMGRISEKERKQLGVILHGMVEKDALMVTEGLESILNTGIPERDLFSAAVQDLLELYMSRKLGDLNIAQVLEALIRLMRAHHIVLPSRFMLVARAFMIAEGVALKLCPDFNFISVFAPFMRRLALEQLKPQILRKRLSKHTELMFKVLHDLPIDTAAVLRLMKQGELHLGFRMEGLEPLRDTLETVGTRFTFGLLLAATLISTSLIMHAGIPPIINGIPLIGIIGYVISGIMTLGFLLDLVMRIIRRAKKGD